MGVFNLMWSSAGGRGDNWEAMRKESFHRACMRLNAWVAAEDSRCPGDIAALTTLRNIFFSYYYAAHFALQDAFLNGGRAFEKSLRRAMELTAIEYNHILGALHASGVVSDGTSSQHVYNCACQLLRWAGHVYERPPEWIENWVLALNDCVRQLPDAAERVHLKRYNEIASILHLEESDHETVLRWLNLEYRIRTASYTVYKDPRFAEYAVNELALHAPGDLKRD
jgi:hypothetical protein